MYLEQPKGSRKRIIFPLRTLAGGNGTLLSRGAWTAGMSAPAMKSGSIIDELRPTYIVVVGIAGGLCDPPPVPQQGQPNAEDEQSGREGIKVGDVLIAEHLEYAEFLKVVDDKTISHRHFSIDQPSFWMRRNFLAAMEHTLDLSHIAGDSPAQRIPRLLYGQVVSAEKIFSAEGNPVQDILLGPFTKALGVDMGIGRYRSGDPRDQASVLVQPTLRGYRGISDLVGRTGNQAMREAWKKFAARAASVVAHALVTELPLVDELSINGRAWWHRFRTALFSSGT